MARYTDQGCFFYKAALADRASAPPKGKKAPEAEDKMLELSEIVVATKPEEDAEWVS
jgi:hypothetical protein